MCNESWTWSLREKGVDRCMEVSGGGWEQDIILGHTAFKGSTDEASNHQRHQKKTAGKWVDLLGPVGADMLLDLERALARTKSDLATRGHLAFVVLVNLLLPGRR